MPNLAAVDWMILLIYFFFVISIGLGLKQYIAASGDYLLGGRALPAWLCGLALAGASLGSLEVLGMGAAGAQYGAASASALAVGAAVPLLFCGLFMTPLYYGSKARSLPDFLRLRFDRKTRTLNAVLTAVISILFATLSFYAMARVSAALHLFDAMFHAQTVGSQGILYLSIAAPAAIVLVYLAMGGLTATIYSQAMQFLVLVAGFLPMVYVGLKQVGGWSGVKAGLSSAALAQPIHGTRGLGAMAIAAGVGLVLSAGYWCTDMSLLQNAMAAENGRAARRAPLIAAAVLVFLPFVLVMPGMIAAGLPTPHSTTTTRIENGEIFHEIEVVPRAVEQGSGLTPARTDSTTDPMAGNPLHDASGRVVLDYGMAMPNLLPHTLPTGLLGLGLAALFACLIGGVAARIAALNTVFAYDLYQPCLRKNADERQLLAAGRWASAGGVAASALLACGLLHLHAMPGILELLALAFALFNAPMLATFLLGMFWKRATGQGAFAGLIAGYVAALAHYGLTLPVGAERGFAGGWIAVLHRSSSGLAQSFWTAVIAIGANLAVTAAVSLATAPQTEMVQMRTKTPGRLDPKRPWAWAAAILAAGIAVSLIFG